MPKSVQNESSPPPPHAQLIQMGTAHWVSRVLYVAVKLALADELADGPKTADELADRTHMHGPSLFWRRTPRGASRSRRWATRSSKVHRVRPVPPF
jgi:hypothetical protein